MNRRALHLLAGAAIAAALALAGCGDGGDDNSTPTAASTGTNGAETSAAQSGQQQKATKGSTTTGPEGASGASFTLGSPADVPRSEGGDNSIQDYGSEASEGDRAAAGRTVAAYFAALSSRDTEQACTLLSSDTREKIEQTLKQISGQGGNVPTSCPQILSLTMRTGANGTPGLRVSEVLSLRQQDDQAFLIYTAPDGKAYAMPMNQEDSNWRVGGVSPSPLGA